MFLCGRVISLRKAHKETKEEAEVGSVAVCSLPLVQSFRRRYGSHFNNMTVKVAPSNTYTSEPI